MSIFWSPQYFPPSIEVCVCVSRGVCCCPQRCVLLSPEVCVVVSRGVCCCPQRCVFVLVSRCVCCSRVQRCVCLFSCPEVCVVVSRGVFCCLQRCVLLSCPEVCVLVSRGVCLFSCPDVYRWQPACQQGVSAWRCRALRVSRSDGVPDNTTHKALHKSNAPARWLPLISPPDSDSW